MLKGIETPWGFAYDDETITFTNGIVRVHTASHGGFYVPDNLLPRIPKVLQRWAAVWSGSKNWYEEDCCCAAVVAHIPEVFTREQTRTAQSQLLAMLPDILKQSQVVQD